MAFSILSGEQVSRDWSCGIGASITTSTEDVDIKLAALRTDANNLNIDITNWFAGVKDNPKAKTFVNAWVRWRDESYQFIKSWKEGPFYKIKLAWNYWDNAVERMHELAKWRERWERLSGQQSTAPASQLPPLPSSGGSGGGAWKWAAILGLGGIGALLVAKKVGG